MFERIIEWVLRHNLVAQMTAALLQRLSIISALCGIAGHLVVVLNLKMAPLGPDLRAGRHSLEMLYPSLVTWWIPESPTAWFFLIFFFACAITFELALKEIARLGQ